MKQFPKSSVIMMLAVAALLWGAGIASARDYTAEGMECVHTPYPENIVIYDTPAPKGFVATNIWHYGRHGSRRAAGKGQVPGILEPFTKADQAGLLTEEGKQILKELQEIQSVFDGEIGELSFRGGMEHQRIASDLSGRYKSVFKGKGKKIHSVSSNSPRVVASMCNFTNKLKEANPSFQYTFQDGDKWRQYVCDNTNVQELYNYFYKIGDRHKADMIPADGFMARVFTDSEKAMEVMKLKDWDIIYKLYGVGSLCRCNDLDVDLYSHLGMDILVPAYKIASALFYCQNCNSPEYGEYRIGKAQNLADDIVAYGDALLDGSAQYVCDLHFGHDTGIAPLLSLIGIDGCEKCMSFDEALEWDSSRYIPMGVNFDVVFYRNRKGEMLVKFLHNELETSIPALTPVSGPYYRWEDVKAHLSK